MTTAIDTNVLVALLSSTSDLADIAQASLDRAARRGALIVAAPVYAELLATPGGAMVLADQLLAEARIAVDWSIGEPIWRAAGLAYRGYAKRRRAQRNDPGPRWLLADFVIGAHAVQRAATLLTFDPRLYHISFPALAVRAPGEQEEG